MRLPPPLRYPFPQPMRVIRADTETVTVMVTMPWEVARAWSETLELAARMTGWQNFGALVTAMSAECQSTWHPLVAEHQRQREGKD